MFVNAIKTVNSYVRPILFISRTLSGGEIRKGAATMFYVNNNHVAITCKHVAEILRSSDAINQNYAKYKTELNQLRKDSSFNKNQRQLMKKYNLTSDSVIDSRIQLFGLKGLTDIDIMVSDKYDLAILKLNGVQETDITGHAIFLSDIDKVQPGKSLCRIGYPFPEFDHFTYNKEIDSLQWLSEPVKTPCFPIDGIITRLAADSLNSQVYGIEMSTPGLLGQSGGPLFDENGVVFGMQFQTSHVHLGFPKIDMMVSINGKNERVVENAFLHLGRCYHVSVIKEFLKSNGITFFES